MSVSRTILLAIAASAALSVNLCSAAGAPGTGPAPPQFKPALPLAGSGEQVTFLYYADLTAPREFYGKVLGLQPYYDQDWVVIYRVNAGAAIGLVKSEDEQLTAANKRDAVMVSFVTQDADAWFSRLRQLPGIVVQKQIYNHPVAPIRTFLLQDPGGYSVEFFQWLK